MQPEYTCSCISETVGVLRLDKAFDSRSITECNSCVTCGQSVAASSRQTCVEMRAGMCRADMPVVHVVMRVDMRLDLRADMRLDMHVDTYANAQVEAARASRRSMAHRLTTAMP